MASLRRTQTAAAVTTDLLRYALAGLVALALTSIMTNQAQAQKGATSSELVAEALEICGTIVTDVDDAEAELADTGWFIEYAEANGPFVWELSASKIYDDGTDVYIFALIEVYPTGLIGYCSFDAQAVPVSLDFEAVAEEYDVPGMIKYTDIGIYGAWEEVGDGGVYYVLANQDIADNYFFLQMTFVSQSDGAIGDGAK